MALCAYHVYSLNMVTGVAIALMIPAAGHFIDYLISKYRSRENPAPQDVILSNVIGFLVGMVAGLYFLLCRDTTKCKYYH